MLGFIERVRTHRVVRDWLAGKGLPRWIHLLVGLFLPLYVLGVNMWRVHWFTVDDAYISFRYARNLADGFGLVYNPGEPIEGYTNFLWTVIIAGGIEVGIDPHITSKVLGAAAAVGTMVAVYALADRLLPLRSLPCVATWLLASSSTFSGYAVFGLETTFFVFLIVAGTLLMFREDERDRAGKGGFVWSGVVFALAGLTRPEAPMYIGIPMLLLGRRFFGRQNLLRGIVFAAPLVAHLFWRHAYYGEWLPATLTAKTGDMRQQYNGGKGYLLDWVEHAGPIVFFSMFGLGMAVARRSRELGSIVAVFIGVLGYILIVGGDWMSYYRFMAPAEPYCFLLAGAGVRQVVEYRDRAALVALAVFGVFVGVQRVYHLDEAQKKWMKEEKRFWDVAAGQTATFLADRMPPGRIAIGDIGYVGYKTNYPVLDLLGLVDREIAALPGGYTRKLGRGFRERFFDASPEYAVLILSGQNCNQAAMEGSRLIFDDPRFKARYELAHNVQVNADAGWCVFKRHDVPEAK